MGVLVAFSAVGVLVAGCGSSNSAAPPPSAPDKPAATTTAPTTTVPPTTTVVTAADGTNLAACEDGDCEVRVTPSTSIPLRSSLGVGPVSVTDIQADTVTVSVAASAGDISDNCTGDPSCVPDMSGSFGGGGDATVASATGHVGANVILDRLTVSIVAVHAGSAVLRLSVR
jgi:hypothetical protein